MLARIINEKLQQGLPSVGTLSDCRFVSGYNLLPLDILYQEGWKEVIENRPEITEGQSHEIDVFEDDGTNIVINYKVIIDAKPTKEQLILNESQECNSRILAGFESNCLGQLKHFDCEMSDQAIVQGLAIAAILGLQGLSTEETRWKASGELECYKFEYSQALQLAIDMKKHIENNIDLFNAKRLEILNAV